MTAPIRIAVAGAGGRMGQALIASVLAADDLALASALGRAGGVVTSVDVDAALGRADVLIDFTRPEGTVAHAAACARHGVALVAGTTGLSDAQKDELAQHARTVP